DLKNKIWRAVGDPFKRFVEDPTRIMRALRQSVEMGLSLDHDTMASIVTNYKLLNEIAKESIVRITDELIRLLHGLTNNPQSHILKFLFDSNIAQLFNLPNSLSLIMRCNGENSNIRIRTACLLNASHNSE